MCHYSGPLFHQNYLKSCGTAFLGLSFDFITSTLSMVPLLNSYIRLQSLVFNNKRPIKCSCQALLGMAHHPPFNFQQYHLVYHWFYGSLILFRQSHRLSMYFVSATYFQPPCHPSVMFVSPKCLFVYFTAF